MGSLRFLWQVFNKSGSVMHMLWWGIKASLILKYLKNGIERLQVVSGKTDLPVEGEKSLKTRSTQNKTMLVVRGEGEQSALILFCMKPYGLIGCCFGVFFAFFRVWNNSQRWYLGYHERGKDAACWGLA